MLYKRQLAPILMVGTFPPPTHGMAVFNDYMRQHLTEAGFCVQTMDTSPGTLRRHVIARFVRLGKILIHLYTLLRVRKRLKQHCLYISLAGGVGQLYDLAFLVLFRRFGSTRIILHHHSSAYLTKHRRVTNLLLNLAGPEALNVVACSSMGRKLSTLYPCGHNIISVSGVLTVTLQEESARFIPGTPFTLGFLSNVSAAKGVLDFIDTLRELQNRGANVRGLIAGPFVDRVIEKRVRKALTVIKNTQYVGAVFGEHKNSFLKSLHAFVFPTRYVNETEGIVVHEAMSRGIPIIATDRACIRQFVFDGGLVIEEGRVFSSVAANKVESWIREPNSHSLAKAVAYETYKKNYATSSEELCVVKKFILSE